MPPTPTILDPPPDTPSTNGDGYRRPAADPTKEYLAGGHTTFPLTGQIELSRAVDDLTRDLGPQIYEVMLNDPTVASGFWVLATGILSGEFQVLAAEQIDEDEEKGEDGLPVDPERRASIELAEEIVNFCKRQIARLSRPIKEVSAEFLYGMAYGTKLAEKVFEVGDGDDADKLCLKRLRFKSNRSWAFVVDPFGEPVAIRGTVVGGGYDDLPVRKFMIFSWMPTDGNPLGHSVLRSSYNGWNLKINSWPKYFKYLDKYASPTAVGIAAADATDEPEINAAGLQTGTMLSPTAAMGQMLSRLESAGWVAVRAGSDVKFVQAAGDGSAFRSAIDLFKHEILEGILLSARSTMEAKHGSKADAEAAGDVVGQLLTFGREALENLYEDQLFHHLVELNWGKEIADRYTPDVSLGRVEKKDVAALLAAFASVGYVLDPSHLPKVDAMVDLPARTPPVLQPVIMVDAATGEPVKATPAQPEATQA